MSGERFLVPYEHFTSKGPNPPPSPMDAPIAVNDGDHSFRVSFTSAWLSAHIDGFQPVLSGTLESTVVHVFTVRPESALRQTDVELWHSQSRSTPRTTSGLVEPNTGLQIAVPDPSSIGASMHLMDTPSRPGRDYPQDPPWRVHVCEQESVLMRDASGTGTTSPTRCGFRFHVVYDITFDASLSGENLSLRSEVGHAVSREIMRWMLMAAELPQPRGQQ